MVVPMKNSDFSNKALQITCNGRDCLLTQLLVRLREGSYNLRYYNYLGSKAAEMHCMASLTGDYFHLGNNVDNQSIISVVANT